ncbi:hypothetical protein DM01DRAFT_1126439 [Hesseltinella vesiculosa]|uniref:Peptidase S9A N-terminal domain-containing protein n=1 Tax=Hesseltinella vesiculosa TaxID=101127 RepID=A0A1X2GUD8_9FUNG|nr:hypothetical protein DM01DRAFT_1126439 [Hesseltinella vesiculosa]
MLVRSISVTARFTKSSGQERRSYSSFLSSLRSTFASKTPQPPRPREIENIQAYHGKQRSDPFAWMENIDDPHLPSYIQAENEYCKGYMRQHRFLQKVILKVWRRACVCNTHPT